MSRDQRAKHQTRARGDLDDALDWANLAWFWRHQMSLTDETRDREGVQVEPVPDEAEPRYQGRGR